MVGATGWGGGEGSFLASLVDRTLAEATGAGSVGTGAGTGGGAGFVTGVGLVSAAGGGGRSHSRSARPPNTPPASSTAAATRITPHRLELGGVGSCNSSMAGMVARS